MKWFLCHKEEVHGPYETSTIRQGILDGKLDSRWLIWGLGQEHWVSLSTWAENSLASQGASAEDLEVTRTAINQAASAADLNPRWHWAYQGESHGPVDRPTLLKQIKSVDHLGEILIWTKGMQAWTTIFGFHDILNELGVNMREFPRAQATGKVILRDEELSYVGQLKSISKGGFGAEGLTGIKPGMKLRVEIQNDEFYQSITAKALVRYVSETGYVGFKFENLSAESLSSIVEYVKNHNLEIKVKEKKAA